MITNRKARTSRQNGLAIIEFTVVSAVLLIVLFGIIEIARFVFSLQMLNEVTRRGARLATVCYVDQATKIPDLTSIKALAPYGYEKEMLKIDYLDDEGNVLYSGTGTISNDTFLDIRFVRARIVDFSYAFSLLKNILGDSISMPSFETILPSESLGIYRPLGDDTVPTSPNCA
ncbi:hypothetical protein BCS96_02340 [Vibrio breoganii]|uniref:TadE family protein n=1 Tax=Vibrio breoganii TaxID=553239 RepID=UPI000C846387|nr:TadE/TadG family type IV pilus assembly protein [Vibrio breoganii]PMG37198.1 hypothetical protein BCU93_15660 [Vibrio breoganii]PML84476.1 hypothetical protein BCT68_08315 [Vibrio breoganii]PMM48769.1 hypothetical protein BCT52_04015 [Vibrio breoganii]PMM84345.1 hypothetical protein BCT45_09740 [Vibrio breoganii]PMO90204.1 hypothetical protein BCS98_02370 [Vibrio breoganii]